MTAPEDDTFNALKNSNGRPEALPTQLDDQDYRR